MNNDIERYNFWHLELEEITKKEKLGEVIKKLEGKEFFPEQIKEAKKLFTNMEDFHHPDLDNRFDF